MSQSFWCEWAVVDGAVAKDVSIIVNDGRFTAVTPNSTASPDATRRRGLTLPGFANAHSHAFHRAIRGRAQADRGSFWTWRKVMYRAAERLNPDTYHRLARATFAEMAMAGVSAVGEFHYVHHQPDGKPYDRANAMGEAMLAAADEAGIRITLLDTLYLRGGFKQSGYNEPGPLQQRFSDGTVEAWAERVEQLEPSAQQRIGAAVHSVRAVDPKAMEALGAWASQRGAVVHGHVSEQITENDQCFAVHRRTPTALLHDAGLLGPRFSAVHGTHLTDGDIALYGSTKSTVCFCPTTERDLGDGIGPSRALVEAGARLTVGTDSHAVIDLFEEARALELNERLRSQERGIHPAPTLLAIATHHGHDSLGFDDAGTLAPGQRADLVTVALDTVRTAGTHPTTALETALFAATTADITHVTIDGEAIVVDGVHQRLDVVRELQESIDTLFD